MDTVFSFLITLKFRNEAIHRYDAVRIRDTTGADISDDLTGWRQPTRQFKVEVVSESGVKKCRRSGCTVRDAEQTFRGGV